MMSGKIWIKSNKMRPAKLTILAPYPSGLAVLDRLDRLSNVDIVNHFEFPLRQIILSEIVDAFEVSQCL